MKPVRSQIRVPTKTTTARMKSAFDPEGVRGLAAARCHRHGVDTIIPARGFPADQNGLLRSSPGDRAHGMNRLVRSAPPPGLPGSALAIAALGGAGRPKGAASRDPARPAPAARSWRWRAACSAKTYGRTVIARAEFGTSTPSSRSHSRLPAIGCDALLTFSDSQGTDSCDTAGASQCRN